MFILFIILASPFSNLTSRNKFKKGQIVYVCYYSKEQNLAKFERQTPEKACFPGPQALVMVSKIQVPSKQVTERQVTVTAAFMVTAHNLDQYPRFV